MEDRMFMIRHKETGLFSKGDSACHKKDYEWNKKNKIWKGVRSLKRHLNQYSNETISQWEVIEYKMYFSAAHSCDSFFKRK